MKKTNYTSPEMDCMEAFLGSSSLCETSPYSVTNAQGEDLTASGSIEWD